MKKYLSATAAMFREHPLRAFLSLFALATGSFLLSQAWSITGAIRFLAEQAFGSQGITVTLANGTVSDSGSYERTMPPDFDSSFAQLVANALPQASAPSPVVESRFDRIQVGDKTYQVRSSLGVGPSYLEALGLKLTAGSNLEQADIDSSAAKALISEDIAAALFGSAEEAVGKTFDTVMMGRMMMRQGPGNAAGRNVQSTRQTFTIAGVYSIPNETYREKMGIPDMLYPYTTSTLGAMRIPESFYWGTMVFSVKGMNIEEVRDTLLKVIAAEKGEDTSAVIWQGNPRRPNFNTENTSKALYSLQFMVTLLGLVLVLVSGVGMYGIMTVEVAGRIKQYGVRRALGATRSDIAKLVLEQAASIAILGSLAGVILALLLRAPVIGQLSPWFEKVGLDPEISARIPFDILPYLAAVLSVVAASAAFGILPAIRVMRAEPVSLLREETL
jgi:ABC-type antimicrobial peptide transport system permease subunit